MGDPSNCADDLTRKIGGKSRRSLSLSASTDAQEQQQQQQQQCEPSHHKGSSSSRKECSSSIRSGEELIFDFHTLPPHDSLHPQILSSQALMHQQQQEKQRQEEKKASSVAGLRRVAAAKSRCKQWRQSLASKRSDGKNSSRHAASDCGVSEVASLWSDFHAFSCIPDAPHAANDIESEEGSHSHRTAAGERVHPNGKPAADPQTSEMLRILRFMIRKQEADDRQAQRVMEWRLLALAIDKILFWIFLIVTFISSFIFLLYIPIRRRGFSFLFG